MRQHDRAVLDEYSRADEDHSYLVEIAFKANYKTRRDICKFMATYIHQNDEDVLIMSYKRKHTEIMKEDILFFNIEKLGTID